MIGDKRSGTSSHELNGGVLFMDLPRSLKFSLDGEQVGRGIKLSRSARLLENSLGVFHIPRTGGNRDRKAASIDYSALLPYFTAFVDISPSYFLLHRFGTWRVSLSSPSPTRTTERRKAEVFSLQTCEAETL